MKSEISIENLLDQLPEQSENPSDQSRKNQVRVPYAEKDGRLVHVSTVQRGLKCDAVCPVCKTAVVARKGEKTRHHFAHYPGANCSTETVLHTIAKQLIYEKLVSAIALKQIMQIDWQCKACSHNHSLNLLDNVNQAVMEKNLEDCRPDIALLDNDNNVRALLEIVVSHRPDKKVLDYCRRQNIPLLIFRIHSAESLEALHIYRNLDPTTVLYCLRDRCSHCGAPLFHKHLFIINNSCWRCGAPMKLAAMKINKTLHGITHFSKNDREIARSNGVIFREYFNKKTRQRELAAACPNCGIVTGNRFIGFQKRTIQKQTGIYRGKICLNCLTHFDEPKSEFSK